MHKEFIQNRKGQKIAVVVEQPQGEPKGLAFVMHGLGGFKEQQHIRTIVEVFLDNGYMTVTFDTTNTIGESEGDYADATTTNYYEDLEDVVSWSKSQSWYQEPFVLVGHSLGGISVALYAENYPEKVSALSPYATVVSGKLSAEKYSEKELKEWKETGWRIKPSLSKPGFVKKLKWSEFEDRLKYDLLPEAKKLKMPVLMVVGSEDDGTSPEHQKILYDKLPGKKELHIIQGADHSFRPHEKHLKELKEIFDNWIKSLT